MSSMYDMSFSVDVECPECGHCFEYTPVQEDENVPSLNVTQAAEALFLNYCSTPPSAGEVDGLAEDITQLLTEKYHVSRGII